MFFHLIGCLALPAWIPSFLNIKHLGNFHRLLLFPVRICLIYVLLISFSNHVEHSLLSFKVPTASMPYLSYCLHAMRLGEISECILKHFTQQKVKMNRCVEIAVAGQESCCHLYNSPRAQHPNHSKHLSATSAPLSQWSLHYAKSCRSQSIVLSGILLIPQRPPSDP